MLSRGDFKPCPVPVWEAYRLASLQTRFVKRPTDGRQLIALHIVPVVVSKQKSLRVCQVKFKNAGKISASAL